MKNNKEKFDIYKIINQKILENLKTAGSWEKMWACGGKPQNLESGHRYKGMNFFLLWGEDKPFYLTFLQIKNNGLKLKKGAKSDIVVFWKIYEYQNKEGGEGEAESKSKTGAMLRYYKVFNIKDIEIPKDHKLHKKLIKLEGEKFENEKLKEPEQVVNGYLNSQRIAVKDSEKAAYYPQSDCISMPPLNSFNNSNAYYSTFFHEMAHSTGHEKRLKREGILDFNGFGSHSYSKEELVAELTAAYLSGKTKIDTDKLIENSAAYLNSWMERLKDQKNKTFLAWAIPRAEKAAEFILKGAV